MIDRNLGKLIKLIENKLVFYHFFEADKSRFIKPLFAKYGNLSPYELDEMLDFFKKHNEVKVDWNQKDKENLFLDLVNIMNDSIKKSDEKQEEKKFYRQIDAKELLSNHPEFAIIPELENEEWVFACPKSYEGAKFADSAECGGVGAKWCIGYEKEDSYWKQYIDEGSSFVLALRKDFKMHQDKDDIKYMIELLPDNGFNVWNQIDKNIIKNNKDKFELLFNVESEILITIGKEFFDNNLKDGHGYEIDGDTLIIIDNDFEVPKRKQFSKVIISSGVTVIGDSAFWDCSGLTSIDIPNSVMSIDDDAFRNCSGLMSITIPDSVMNIGNSAFIGCSNLMSVKIESNADCSKAGLYLKDNLTYRVLNKDSVGIVYDYFYSGDVVIPDTFAAGNTFAVMSIDSCAFEYCKDLTSVMIPDSVTSIGERAFNGCDNLTTLTIKAKVPPQLSSSNILDGCDSLKSIFVPKESIEDYKSAEEWEEFADIIKGI